MSTNTEFRIPDSVAVPEPEQEADNIFPQPRIKPAAAVIRENLIEVGQLLDLPPEPAKTPPKATKPDAPAPAEPEKVAAVKSSRGFSGILFGCAALLLAVVGARTFWPSASTALPAALIGEWTTSNKAYAGRSFSFTPTTVAIGTQSGVAPMEYPIKSVELTVRAETTAFVITYLDNGDPVELPARYIDRADKSTIEFARPEGLQWHRRVR